MQLRRLSAWRTALQWGLPRAALQGAPRPNPNPNPYSNPCPPPQDPSYPVYVDSSVMMGMTGHPKEDGSGFEDVQYMVCRPENDFFPDLSKVSPSVCPCACARACGGRSASRRPWRVRARLRSDSDFGLLWRGAGVPFF